MALVVKLKSSNIFWTGKPDSVWSDNLNQAKRFEDLENAELEVEENVTKYGYFTEIVDETEITVVVTEEPVVSEEPVIEE